MKSKPYSGERVKKKKLLKKEKIGKIQIATSFVQNIERNCSMNMRLLGERRMSPISWRKFGMSESYCN